MEPLSVTAMWAMGASILTGGVAFGAARSKMTDLTDDQKDLKDELVRHKRDDIEVHRQLIECSSRTEAKLDLVLEELRRRS